MSSFHGFRPRPGLLPLVALAGLAILPACDTTAPVVEEARPGDPLPGLSPAELARFEAGLALFDRVFEEADGTGPLFNENQCSACHTDPAQGGTGEQLVLKATRVVDGTCDPLASLGGENLRRRVTAAGSAAGLVREAVPDEATETGQFNVPFLFGLGLADAIPEATLLSRADPDDQDGDGISGRPGRTPDGRVGRFGRKADVATLRDFTAAALFHEMGLTSVAHPGERPVAGVPIPPAADPAPDPEVDESAIDTLTDFVRFLAPPTQPAPVDAERARAIEEGRAVFEELGCPSCHVPELRTGPSEVQALSRRTARLYSDFLLHDLGEALAGVCSSGASPTEYRTAPLVGLSSRRTYLHDGRARRVEEAIELHGGEAARQSAEFRALSVVSRDRLMTFLGSL